MKTTKEFLAATALATLATPAFAQVPIALSFDSPNALGAAGVMYDSGWALTLRADMPNSLYHISRASSRGDRPFGDNEFIVLTDPDNCLDLRTKTVDEASHTPGCGGPDEQVLDVHVDLNDSGGVADRPKTGTFVDTCPEPSSELVKPTFQRLLLTRVAPTDPGAPVPPPPTTHDDAPSTGPELAGFYDCYGYGQDDDLPGLVVMADIGAARFYSDTFDRLPLGIKNMAGLLSNVTVELSGARGSSVVATILVKRRFFDPLVMIDADVTEAPWTGFDYLQRVDGGPVTGHHFPVPRPPSAGIGWIPNAIADLIPIRQVRVRAVLVSGRAPSVIKDLNADGLYTAADVELAGKTLLSNEASIVIRTAGPARLDDNSDTACPVPSLMYNDLDGNDSSGTACITGSSNSKVRVPR
jgi:hypothetical protein